MEMVSFISCLNACLVMYNACNFDVFVAQLFSFLAKSEL